MVCCVMCTGDLAQVLQVLTVCCVVCVYCAHCFCTIVDIHGMLCRVYWQSGSGLVSVHRLFVVCTGDLAQVLQVLTVCHVVCTGDLAQILQVLTVCKAEKKKIPEKEKAGS